MNIRKNTIIYVGCPAFNNTGGTELAHQLVREINELGGHAKILYYDITVKNNAETVNPALEIMWIVIQSSKMWMMWRIMY
ncbi:hypothetical protein [Limosilactobacillus reuteri]|uniref:hypothetical protein n=1 Tax=Limosilactobacillus reuteri TaxID=1598 RepID=UPI001CDB4065|nr:hypothetical protein [Limosilactobacillus reuteri]